MAEFSSPQFLLAQTPSTGKVTLYGDAARAFHLFHAWAKLNDAFKQPDIRFLKLDADGDFKLRLTVGLEPKSTAIITLRDNLKSMLEKKISQTSIFGLKKVRSLRNTMWN